MYSMDFFKPNKNFDFFGHFDDLFKNLDTFLAPASDQAWNPSLNVDEYDDAYHVHVELPGCGPEDVNISVDGGLLRITGTRTIKREVKDDKAKTHIQECQTGKFNRTIRLGPTVDADRIGAKMNNGILNIILPKSNQSKKIDIVVE